MEVFKGKWQSYLSRKLLNDKLNGEHLFTEENLVVGLVVTEDKPDTTAGDFFTAMELANSLKKLGYEIGSFIHPSAVISNGVQLKNALVFQNVSIDAFCTIGEGCIFYPGANISHHSTIGNYNFFAPSSCLCGHLTIQDQCFIGANSCIKNGCCIGERSLIGATAYVSQNIGAESVIVPPPKSFT
jgi:UDP-3-O-[3-hydroxymyristoyl] glucosamine N-acyltransferase